MKLEYPLRCYVDDEFRMKCLTGKLRITIKYKRPRPKLNEYKIDAQGMIDLSWKK